MKAINKKHQAMVNRAVKWLDKYNEANNQRDVADGNGDEKLYRRYDRMCEKYFDKYEECTSELPKREVEQIEKSEIY